jgi:ABC-type polar amino acid transport system ATPase subunit
MRQNCSIRVAMARSLALPPKLMLFDEVTSALGRPDVFFASAPP